MKSKEKLINELVNHVIERVQIVAESLRFNPINPCCKEVEDEIKKLRQIRYLLSHGGISIGRAEYCIDKIVNPQQV